MFQSARLKLTGWYLLIIMLVSLLFSGVIFEVISHEYDRIEIEQKLRQERAEQGINLFFQQFLQQNQQFINPPIKVPKFDPQPINEARIRLIYSLLLANLGIFGIAGILGYFLAGITLQPIKQMVDEQNRFITDSSHELRTPITSLKTATEVYLRGKDHNIKEADKLLESNLEEINNLQTLSDNLIKLAQYQKTNGNFVFEKVEIKSLIEEAIKKVATFAKHKHITIKDQVGELSLESDSASVIELFVIILDNAIKYSHPKSNILVSAYLHDDFVFINVVDTGIGIDPQDIPHLFERFYRADKSRNAPGYGLGLPIAKQIVEKHHGVIKIESEIGKGTSVIVCLPLKQPKSSRH